MESPGFGGMQRPGYGGVGGGIFRPPNRRTPGTQAPAGDSVFDRLGLAGALYELPGESAFFEALMGRRARGLEATAQAQRQSLFGALEARGLGQSSVVGMGLADIGRQQGLGLQEAQADIANQQFLMREGRIRDAMEFERQKYLMDRGRVKVPWWQSFLGSVGGAVGTYLGLRGSGGGGGGSNTGSPYEPQPWEG